jgi:hypothetical protein
VRDFRIDLLTSTDFEGLVGHIGREVLGMGTITFASGPDGGRDGRFEGTAEAYPSSREPWIGKFILQAKHTGDRSASCSDGTFFGNKSSIVSCEIPRMRSLREAGELDNYIMFTNRRLAAGKEREIVEQIRIDTAVPRVALCGIEYIAGILERHPEIVSAVGLDRLLGPIRFHAEDLKQIIEGFHVAVGSEQAQRTIDVSASLRHYADLDEKNKKGSSPIYVQAEPGNACLTFNTK